MQPARCLPLLLIYSLVSCKPAVRQPSGDNQRSTRVDAAAAELQAQIPMGGTGLVVLGSGTPIPLPKRQGPAVALVSGSQSILVDAGPGVVRQAQATNIPQLAPPQLRTVFLSHLHSDHTLGLPDLMFTPWVVGRRSPLQVYGPPGTEKMVRNLERAYAEDQRIRTSGAEGLPPLKVVVTELTGGEELAVGTVRVKAIAVNHGSWEHALGFSFDTPHGTVVVSGDATYSKSIQDACQECELLVHEVFEERWFERIGAAGRRYHGTFHTSTRQLAELAKVSRPKRLVLYHQLGMSKPLGPALLREIAAHYSGATLSANDLDVFVLGND